MNRIWAYLVIICLANPAYASAEEVMSEKSKAELGLAQGYANFKEYNKSIAILKNLRRSYPENGEIAAELISAFYAAGMDPDADSVLEAFLKKGIKNRQELLNLVKVLSGKEKYASVERICRAALEDNPQDARIRLWLARVLSWQQEYEGSLKQYEEIIKNRPDWTVPMREKARVLGWQHRYADSLREYKRILTEVDPKSENTLLEMAAKRGYYNFFDKSGIGDYQRWLEMEEDNPEALFDLGQIYARQMRWAQARQAYQRLLDLYPNESKARAVLDKINRYSSSMSGELGFSHYEADSASRDIDEKYWAVYAKAIAPLNDDWYLGAGENTVFYTPSAAKSFNRYETSIFLEYYNNPVFWARGSYGFSAYTGAPKNSSNFDTEINYHPLDPWFFSFYSCRKDVEDNPQTMDRNLKRNDFRIRSTLRPNYRITAGTDYTFSYFNDDNQKYTYGLDVEYRLFYEPHSLSLRYRYEAYGFRQARDYYFTPGSFHFNALGIEWKQSLNPDLFWGSNNTFYMLGYAVNFDVHKQIGNRIYANIHRDWNNRLSTHLEWSKKIYNHRDIYGDEQLVVFLKYSF